MAATCKHAHECKATSMQLVHEIGKARKASDFVFDSPMPSPIEQCRKSTATELFVNVAQSEAFFLDLANCQIGVRATLSHKQNPAIEE